VAEVLVLLTNALAVMRDYQDSWILECLVVPFAIFVITYLVYVFVEKRIWWIILFAIIFRAIFSLVPNLKYPWFQGVAIDQYQHYGLVLSIYNTGHITSGAVFERIYEYSGTPLMHLLVATFSKVTSFSPLDAFKYVPFLMWSAYPLFTFVFARRVFSFMKNNTAIKYVVIVSSIPFNTFTSYLVTGTTFGAILVFLFLSQFVKSIEARSRSDFVITLIFGSALVVAHSYSSMILMVGLAITYAIFKVRKRSFKFHWCGLSLGLVSFLIVANVGWLAFYARRLNEEMTSVIVNFISAIRGVFSSPEVTGIYPRFFELGFIDQIKIMLLYYGAIIFLLFLVVIGIIIVLRKIRTSRSLVFLSIYVVSLGLILFAQIILTQFRGGLMTYDRILVYALVLAPIFAGLVLYYIDKKVHRLSRIVTVTIVVSLVLLAIIQIYKPPQLVPPANSINKNLSSNEPIVYTNNVNSVYQRYLIMTAERYIENGNIASDDITRIQFWSSADYTFIDSHVLYYYPLSRLLNKNITQIPFDYFLTHLPGKAGGFTEKAEIRTESVISEYLSNSSIIYTSGESFITTKPFLNFP
jgi:hypothetical protein